MKINCSITENYFKEKTRMTKSCTICKDLDCNLGSTNNGTKHGCRNLEILQPETAVEIVQAWSDTHPQKTYLEDLLEKYPNAELDSRKVPEFICPRNLGYKDWDNCKAISGNEKCVPCWNQIMEEES